LPTSGLLVLDASFAVRTLVALEGSERALDLLTQAHERRQRLLAPNFWLIEVTSAIRKLVYGKTLSDEEGSRALSHLPTLGVETLPLDFPLVQRSLSWAGRLGQARAYDACYLALAEREDATLWTADNRLATRAKQIGVTWVLSLEEIEFR
jgi:predicted nucleic acid-binding protein